MRVPKPKKMTQTPALLAIFLACGLATGCGDSSPHPEGDHLSRSDCVVLARTVSERLDARLHTASEPTPPLSSCRISGPGIVLSVYLDTAFQARRRYANRVVETAQFGAPDPARLPHPVPGVGDPSLGSSGANWVPGLSTLLAVRDKRWLTVTYSVTARSRPRRLREAADLARRAFRLTVAPASGS
jgi:hypothetical protein